MANGATYRSSDGRIEVSSDERVFNYPARVAENNSFKIVLFALVYFSLYFAVMFAAVSTTNDGVISLLRFVLEILNFGFWVFGAIVFMLTLKTTWAYLQFALRRM